MNAFQRLLDLSRCQAFSLGLAAGVCLLAACRGGSSGDSTTPLGPSGPAVTSEADAILHMDQVRAAGFRGAGVRVGVISTGVVNLASYQTAGLIPVPLYISQNTPGPLDEGSWMLELVHQHAPDAVLGFCDGIDLDFDGCIKDLVTNFHADVIVDDILFAGQFYPDATADVVAQLEATNDRLVFIHLAGNEQAGGYWQGPFAPIQTSLGGTPATVLDFGVASGGASDPFNAVTVPPDARLVLFLSWNDPPHEPTNHALTGYLLDGNSQILTQATGQSDPSATLDYTNATGAAQTVRLAVALQAGGSASGLELQVTQGHRTCNMACLPLAYSTSGLAGGTVGDFPDALVVGATMVSAPRVLEPWTNFGPFRIDFTATADPSSPDGYDYARLMTPLSIPKPDLVAPDCVTVGFSDGATVTNGSFCGTSAAVPAIAGAAALLESAGFNRTQVLKALRSTAAPLGAATWDPGYGFGLADVVAAWRSGGN